MLVEFYNPNCPVCRKFKPEFDAAAESLLKLNPPVPMGLINIVKYSGVAQEYGATGTPTVKFFYYGKKAEDYNGGWDRNNMEAWVSYWI